MTIEDIKLTHLEKATDEKTDEIIEFIKNLSSKDKYFLIIFLIDTAVGRYLKGVQTPNLFKIVKNFSPRPLEIEGKKEGWLGGPYVRPLETPESEKERIRLLDIYIEKYDVKNLI